MQEGIGELHWQMRAWQSVERSGWMLMQAAGAKSHGWRSATAGPRRPAQGQCMAYKVGSKERGGSSHTGTATSCLAMLLCLEFAHRLRFGEFGELVVYCLCEDRGVTRHDDGVQGLVDPFAQTAPESLIRNGLSAPFAARARSTRCQ